MCNFLSVCISTDCETIYVGDLRSHSATAELHGLKPGTYREVEWTADDEKSLSVRTEGADDKPENWYRACILAKHKTRDALIQWCLENANKSTSLYLNGCTGLKEIPNLPNVEMLDLSGTAVKELPSLPNVKYLYLSGTAVKELPNLPNVEMLDLSGTAVKELPSLPNVKYLYLSGTAVKELPSLPNVKWLDLRGTAVKRENVPPNLLSKCVW